MPIYDYQCTVCGNVEERIESIRKDTIKCAKCGKKSRRIISMSGVFTGNEDAPWIRTVLDVVDKENPARHVQDFVKNPTRRNYKAWMKGEGIRPADHTDHGGPPVYQRPPPPDLTKITERIYQNHVARKKLEIRS